MKKPSILLAIAVVIIFIACKGKKENVNEVPVDDRTKVNTNHAFQDTSKSDSLILIQSDSRKNARSVMDQ